MHDSETLAAAAAIRLHATGGAGAGTPDHHQTTANELPTATNAGLAASHYLSRMEGET